jgi:V-type H+-transporting ATPase subunit C
LDGLVLLSDDLVKYDTVFEQSVNKMADMLNSLLRSQQGGNLQDHLLVNDSEFQVPYLTRFYLTSSNNRAY